MVDQTGGISLFKKAYQAAKDRLVNQGIQKPTTAQIVAEMQQHATTDNEVIPGFHFEHAQTKYMPPIKPDIDGDIQTKYMPPIKPNVDGDIQTKYMPPIKPDIDGDIQTKYMPPIK